MKSLKYHWVAAGIAWLLVGSMAFWGGYHGVDYSRNILKISYVLGLDYDSFSDRTLGGKVVSFDQAYAFGLKGMILGYTMGMIGAALVCYGLSRK